MNILPPKRICLSGGGIRTLAYIGALEVLEERGLLRNVREYVGVSAGSFVALSLCIGFSLEELKKIALQYDFSVLRNTEFILPSLNLFENFGFDNGQNLVRFLEVMLNYKQLNPQITFRELAKQFPTRPRMRCYATDLVTCRSREYSLAATPNVSILYALRVSMSIPVYFTALPDPETNHLMTDGAVINTCPMEFLTPDEQNETLALRFRTTVPTAVGITDTWDFLQQLFACVYLPRDTLSTSSLRSDRFLFLPNGDYPPWFFEASVADREKLIRDARQATLQFLETNPRDTRFLPSRRYSVA